MKRSHHRAVGAAVGCFLLANAFTRATAQNEIVLENALAGSPSSAWDITGLGDPTIQGFATEMSVDQGETVEFKIDTPSTDYRLDIYRLGYYGGMGARLVTSVEPSVTLPQSQPACLEDPSVNLVDCGNWAVSASWTVPAGATSGIYIAKAIREDVASAGSHIVFIVRDDDGQSDLLFQTSDTTWQAYNRYAHGAPTGGASLYQGPSGKADKVSYNRPFTVRATSPEDWVFNAAYPMLRWLERNGYDVSYFTNIDTDRNGVELLEHDVILSVGHDEYWSRTQRQNVEAAAAAGVQLAFFSGNEIYWKTRWEESLDAGASSHRTLVCYKEGSLGENQCGTKCDPVADVWTGLWRSGCAFAPPADGCEPENALSGQISWVGSTGTLEVPQSYSHLPFWRDTSIATLTPNTTATLSAGTLGYEWDPEQPAYASSYPDARLKLSATELGGQTHHLSLYRHASGALVFGAGTVQWAWGLDGNHDRGASVESPDMKQATVNLFADMGVQPETLEAGLVAAVPLADVDPPSSSIDFPAPAFELAAGVPIVVTGSAVDTGGAGVAMVEISTDGGATWMAAEGRESWSFDWTPVDSGPAVLLSRATDGALRTEIPGAGVSGTILPRICPCDIFGTTIPPTIDSDTQPVELGMKFQTETDGYITAIRFYKDAGNIGTHVGNLWAADGTLLASVAFAGETASGWQEQALSSPLPVVANTTYVVSYHAPAGRYAFSSGYFATATDNPPLRALADGEDGPNGVYHYGPGGIFPTDTFQSANYWVDVIFDTTAEDLQPPAVVTRAPLPGATGVAIGTSVSATFNEAVQENSIVFELRDESLNLVATAFSYDAPSRTATLDPLADLSETTAYTASIVATDFIGNAMTQPVSWSFTTASPPPPPPDEGPGGPILVVAAATNPFGRYYAEILRNEGFNCFTVTDISLVTAPVLDDYDVVILGEMSLSAAQATLFSDWVSGGGNLIAMRPDPQLTPLLGWNSAAATLSEAYLQIETTSGPGVGLVGETIQFHGTADRYTASGATTLATLYSDASTPTAHVAASLRDVGTNGGQAAAFAFDLARSVVYTRQGNPAWAGQERDGSSPIRSDDMFYPDWIDLDKVAIPQADEQQRLLANMILSMNADQKPLPRFWYLPSAHKAAVIMTGDHHGCCAATETRFQTYVDQSPVGCSLEDWECVRASSYVYTNSSLSDAAALAWHQLGFELGVHVNTGCADWTPANLDPSFYAPDLAGFAAQFPSLPPQVSNRTHCIAWSDWVTQAQVELSHGIRLDTNYYYWPGSWVQDRPGMFTGSGMPMRFADLDGTMIDVYQAVTQLTDESDQNLPVHIDALLDGALGSEGYYGVFTANMHTDLASHAGSDAIVASALARGVPVVSGRQMLTWLDGRNASNFGAIAWNAGVLSFDVLQATGGRNLRGMIPTQSSVGPLTSLARDATPIAYDVETIKGVEYAIFSADTGTYAASYQVDSAAPVISNRSAVADFDGNAEVTWTTDEPADSRVDYGINPSDLDQSVLSPALELSHAVTLTNLPPNTLIHYRVTSADAAFNSITDPPLPNSPASFMTPDGSCFGDDTAAEFSAGSLDAATTVTGTDDGELTLLPSESAEFAGTALPSGWISSNWSTGGTVTVSAGEAAIDGARMHSSPTRYGPGRSLEFVATFAAEPFQHAGFAGGDDTGASGIFSTAPWAIFSTGTSASGLLARVWDGGGFLDTALPGSYLGTSHLYRIEWDATEVRFFVDGGLVHTQAAALASAQMRPGASDFGVDGVPLLVDWMRMSDYATEGSFQSRIADAGATAFWGVVSWTADLPTGTSLSIGARTGNTPQPDAGWTPFAALGSSGAALAQVGRYLQYQVDLESTDPSVTPALENIDVACSFTTATGPSLPRHALLHGAVPNPFNPRTTISFELPTESVVSLKIYSMRGRLVRTLANGPHPAGRNDIVWSGEDTAGRRVASGVYLVRLDTPQSSHTIRIALLK